MGNRNSGPRPQPTALKVLRGNPSGKKLNVNEPIPPAGQVTKPATLTAGAGLVWDELAPICGAMGTLTVADLRAFATLCELQSTMEEASAAKDGRPLFRLEHREDPAEPVKIIIDSVLKLERETAAGLKAYYEYFGLTPVARARISVPNKPEVPASKWAGSLQ